MPVYFSLPSNDRLKQQKSVGGNGGQSRDRHQTGTGKKTEVYTKNKTFPLITSVTSRLYPGWNNIDDALHTLMWTSGLIN